MQLGMLGLLHAAYKGVVADVEAGIFPTVEAALGHRLSVVESEICVLRRAGVALHGERQPQKKGRRTSAG